MLATGAAKGHGQVALPFLNVVRKQKEQELGDPVQKLGRLGKFADVFRYLGMSAGQVSKFGHEMRIGQEPDVEHQVGFQRHPVLVAETAGGDQQVLVRIATLKLLQDVGTELMHVVTGRIDADVGQVAKGIKTLSPRMSA